MGLVTEPTTIQLKEPDVKISTPKSHVKKFAPFLLFIIAHFFTITSTNPVIPPDLSMI